MWWLVELDPLLLLPLVAGGLVARGWGIALGILVATVLWAITIASLGVGSTAAVVAILYALTSGDTQLVSTRHLRPPSGGSSSLL